MSKLQTEIDYFTQLFIDLQCTSSRIVKLQLLRIMPEQYKDDWQFILEILNGKHKLGYTFVKMPVRELYPYPEEASLKTYMSPLWHPMKQHDFREMTIAQTCVKCATHADFIEPIVNRTLKLGIGQSLLEKSDISPMLAKSYEGQSYVNDMIYVTEKLDGNRCIAAYDFDMDCWRFYSRNGIEKLGLYLNMGNLDKNYIYDGELLSKPQAAESTKLYNYVHDSFGDAPHYDKAAFRKLNGRINRIVHENEFVYCIFDIMIDNRYSERRHILNDLSLTLESDNVRILPTLVIYDGTINYNESLNSLLDTVTGCGAEGLMLNLGCATYEHRRTTAILKYKKVQTIDMFVEGYEFGTGKYDGMIGALICRGKYNDMDVICKVGSGISDDQRIIWAQDPDLILTHIVEVAYFELSQNEKVAGAPICSLRFPRLKGIRQDKNNVENY